ncbi:transglycosylase domain-containing protein [[Clostridium] polysaccharolyticum]|uniref:Penicillin-binding protein 1A n=1 Tax=[Clostridium] polysaccharolyticum TaxID=29364 RepID=A0A1H9Y6V0_9FIRM|nr:PBP1A family penicillin-binding protein [[Clostridium] polysaccharolyticum]SES64642.1 penicillin-binding protein 1A [[Clostridium] polysaccharolyticum]
MNFSNNGIKDKYKETVSPNKKRKKKASVLFFRTFLICIVLCACIGTFAGIGIVRGIIDNAPHIDSINVAPTTFATTIYDSKGNKMQQLVGSNANRVYVNIEDIPKDLINAFIAVEDERFWSHKGIDVRGIFRAFFLGITGGGFDQGASTLTQQLLKNTVFEGGMETNFSDKFERKIQEQYLALQLENKMDKKTILEYYLNIINLGQNTLGVEAASQRYFNKNVKDLTLSECTVIAGITKNPSAYNPITYPEDNAKRRTIILDKMKEQNYITEEQYQKALTDDVYSRIELVNTEQYASKSNVNSYFVDALVDEVTNDLVEELGYTSTQAYNLIYRSGLSIYATQDPKMQKLCDDVFADESMYPGNSTFELTYRLTVIDEKGEAHNYSEMNLKKYFQKKNTAFNLYFKNRKKADPYIEEYKKHVVGKNDRIDGEVINFVPQPQVSFVLMDQYTGQVKALIGGRGLKNYSRSLNRATATARQPGSTFKILSTYLPALDTKGMTLATVFDDDLYYYPGSTKKVNNWNGEAYNGFTTIRQAIYNSMNVMAVKTLEQVTTQTGFSYLQKLGFTTLVENRVNEKTGATVSDLNLSLALGGITDGVTNLELTNAFATIANGGNYTKPKLYTKILDQTGKIMLDHTDSVSTQVMKDSTSYLLTSAMEDVVKAGTGKKLSLASVNMPVAGKTGTTSNDNDLWFVGYTPYYTAGIWGGYDNNGKQEDTAYHKNLWRTVMEKIHKPLARKEFTRPESITTAKICTKSGKLAIDGVCDHAPNGSTVRTEFFAKGTVPTETCDVHVKVPICEASRHTPSAYCPSIDIINRVYLIKSGEKAQTADTPYILPNNFESNLCPIHTNSGKSPENPEKILPNVTPNGKPSKPDTAIPDNKPSDKPENTRKKHASPRND